MVWHYVKLAWYWMFPVKDEICELSPLLTTKPKTVQEARCESKKERKVRRRPRPKSLRPVWLED